MARFVNLNRKGLIMQHRNFSHTALPDNAAAAGIEPGLIRLARAGLEKMFDPVKQLFCYRAVRSENQLIRKGHSVRYTLISLLGLHRMQGTDMATAINAPTIAEALLERADTLDSIGDVGLLLWYLAQAAPEKSLQLFDTVLHQDVFSRYSDARNGLTTELSWFMTGLVYSSRALDYAPARLTALIEATYNRIRGNYGGNGIFGHQHKNGLRGRTRARFGCFADQVYPIYAFSQYANGEAQQIACECAQTICNLQGPQGQWWWHYDARKGTVLGNYPAFSVHQDAMAPMALFAVAEASGRDCSRAIEKSLAWIDGENELGTSLVDNRLHAIWRKISPAKYKMYTNRLSGLMNHGNGKKQDRSLKIAYECWPYHLGWLLYAFAGRV